MSKVKAIKKGIDGTDARRKREDMQIGLRKDMRNAQIIKRRKDAGAEPASKQIDVTTEQKLQLLPGLIQNVMSDDQILQIQATTQFRKLLSIERSPPIDQVIAANVIPRFVEFLQCADCPHLQFEAAWALTNIASGTQEHTKCVVESGAVPLFVNLLLTSANDDVREQSVWALGNIAGDSTRYRDLILHHDALGPILAQISQSSKVSMLRNASWTLSNLCRGKPQPVYSLVQPALPTLAHLLMSDDREILTDACWALSYLSDGDNTRIQQVIESGVVGSLVELLLHFDPAVQTPALRTIGNIVTGDDTQTQMAINAGALTSLQQLLGNTKKSIRKEACWAISNVTAGTRHQIEMVIQCNIFPGLIDMLQQSEYFDVKKEAAWAIINATSGGSPEQIRYLVNRGALPRLCDLLNCMDIKIMTVALEAIENILRVGEREKANMGSDVNPYVAIVFECEGSKTIERLQGHANYQIYRRANSIIVEYLGAAAEEETPLVPDAEPTATGFGFGGNGGTFQQQSSFGQFGQ